MAVNERAKAEQIIIETKKPNDWLQRTPERWRQVDNSTLTIISRA
jgi:hypothetical protein